MTEGKFLGFFFPGIRHEGKVVFESYDLSKKAYRVIDEDEDTYYLEVPDNPLQLENGSYGVAKRDWLVTFFVMTESDLKGGRMHE